jgi:hypothetical protein
MPLRGTTRRAELIALNQRKAQQLPTGQDGRDDEVATAGSTDVDVHQLAI